MSWIRTIAPEQATGALGRAYEAAVERAGRVYQIVRAMSLQPRTLESSMALYKQLMHGPSALSKRQRELLAVVVSAANECHY